MALNTAFSSGATLTAQQMNNLPFGSVGYATVVTSQTGITTIVDLTGASVTFTAIANRPYLAILTCAPYGTASESADIDINDGSTLLCRTRMYFTYNNVVDTRTYMTVFTLSAGSHTIKARIQRNSGSNVINNYADGSFKTTLAVFDLGER